MKAVIFIFVLVSSTASPLPDPLCRANQTLQGMLEYYWTQDPLHKGISFFFACGQVGGQGSTSWDHCVCINPSSCSNCYRWWDAVAVESLANYGQLNIAAAGRGEQGRGDDSGRDLVDIPDMIFAHSPYNEFWPSNDYTFVDDFGWYGIAYLKVYEWLKDIKWLNRSIGLYDWAWRNGWDNTSDCGGFFWSTWPGQEYKNSITFLEIMHLGSKLAFLYPKEATYLTRTEKIWEWFFSFDNGRGLLSDSNLASTGAMPTKCCNASTENPFHKCHNSNTPGTAYNQGLLLSSSAYLYRATGDKKYLNTGLNLLEAIFANYTTKDGALVDEPRTYQTYNSGCYATSSDPGGDWYSFQGIMMLHLSYFTELLAENNSLPAETLQRIKQFTNITSDSAWTKSSVWPPFKLKDVCNSNGLSPNSTYPKFHWWWSEDVTQQIMPPDPQPFFHKTTLRCFGNETQIWEGNAQNEDICMAKCMNRSDCSKYLFNQNTPNALNCWLWPYNRTNHVCNGTTDVGYNVGFKRPVGNATCIGRCGLKEPQKLVHGVCYCDTDCAKYLDCCLDFAETCQPDEPISCKGLCNTAQAKPLIRGGYCWCFDGCNPWFSDNNSAGSCCLDYPEQCQGVTMPTCLDARSQGSALNLFLAHHKINAIAG